MSARSVIAAVACLATGVLGLAACGGTSTSSSTSVPPTSGGPHVYSFGVVGDAGKLTEAEHETPTPIPGIVGTVEEISTSNSDTYALTTAGTVWAWGAGGHGQLGNATTPAVVDTAVEVSFPRGVDITSLPSTMPFDAALAIDARGDLWAWGLNSSHDLCLASGTVLVRPTRIPLSEVAVAIGAGTHTLISTGRTLYACGNNDDGQLGTGDTVERATPTLVVGLPVEHIVSLTASWAGSGAVMVDGSYYDWGYNALGQLGDGSTVNSAVPVRVALPGLVSEVSQGGSNADNGQTLAVLEDGSMWAWGSGAWGQLGTGTTQNEVKPVPVALPGGAKPIAVCSGGYSSYALDTSGTLWVWGGNDVGQLGTGTSGADQLTPARVDLALAQVASTATNVAGLTAS